MEKRSDFDVDLAFGQAFEARFADVFSEGTKVEVKTERNHWFRTGNIAIEIQSRGKPSGLSVTKADYWVHILADGERSYYTALLFPVARLKELVKIYRSTARGMGDNNANICVLIPLKEVFTHASKRAEKSARRRKSAGSI